MYGLPVFLTMESRTYSAGSFRFGAVYVGNRVRLELAGDAIQQMNNGHVKRLTFLICASRVVEISWAASICSFAIMVRLPICQRSFVVKSIRLS